jgi:uncharacterized protein YqeY
MDVMAHSTSGRSALAQRLQDDLTNAMKSGGEREKSTLRMAIAAVKNAAVAGDAAVELSDDQIVAVLRAEAKKRSEAAEIYTQAGRIDAAAAEREELAVLERYLPPRMDDAELAGIIAEEIERAHTAGATGPKAMGLVVKAVRGRVGDAADGSIIASRVKDLLGI